MEEWIFGKDSVARCYYPAGCRVPVEHSHCEVIGFDEPLPFDAFGAKL